MIVRELLRAGNRNKHWIFYNNKTREFVDIWPIEGPYLGRQNFPGVKRFDEAGRQEIAKTAHDIGVPSWDVQMPLGMLQLTDPALRWLVSQKLLSIRSWDHRPDTRVAYVVFENETWRLHPDQWQITEPPESARNAERLRMMISCWRTPGYHERAHFYRNNDLWKIKEEIDPEKVAFLAEKAVALGKFYSAKRPKSVKRTG